MRKAAPVTIASLLTLSLLTGLYSLLLAASSYGDALYNSFFASPLLILLNLLPPFLLIFALYFATGRAWFAFAVGGGIILIASSINFYKIQIRGDAFTATDFSYLVDAGSILSLYTIKPVPPFTNAAIFGVLGTVWAIFACRFRFTGARRRIIAAALAVALLLGLSATVYMSDTLYETTVGDFENDAPTTNDMFLMRGYLYPFIHSIKAAFPKPPDGYSDEAARELLARYATDAIPADKRVNVISIMLEAFCDLSAYDTTVEIAPRVYDKWHELQAESVHGNLVVNVFAGGTVDTERLFLTGDTYLTDIRGARESYVYYFRDNGYFAEGLHTGLKWFYNRENVHKDLGFDAYYFHGDFHETDRSDALFFSVLGELYARRDTSVPYFNHSLTFQNHGGYDDKATSEPHLIQRGELTDAAFNIINNYLLGINDTVERIWDFVNALRGDPEPLILIIYGDHKPWLGDGEIGYTQLGIDLSSPTAQASYNMHTTPYIIWANDAAKATLGNDFVGEGGDLSPTFLMNRVFALAGWSGDAYMKLANAAFDETPIVNSHTAATDALSELKIAEYYRKHHFAHTRPTG